MTWNVKGNPAALGFIPDFISRTVLREETIIVFQYSWVAVVQPDGKYRVARMD